MAYNKEDTPEIKETIINEMIKGRSLFNIVENENKMPCYMTVFNWLNPESDYHDKEFLYNYTRASMVRADREFEEVLTIADNQEDDVYRNEDGEEVTNHNVIQRARLRVDSRKWRLGKMQPKKYGDLKQVEVNDVSVKPLTFQVIGKDDTTT